ncbi:MAG: cation transporter, partial [Cyanobium sp. PLM2.Bin73]
MTRAGSWITAITSISWAPPSARCRCWAELCAGSTGASWAERLQRRTLWWVLLINAAMFVLELGWGRRAESIALIADSLDMLADAGVYGLALLVLADVLRRSLQGSEPVSGLMMGVGLLALVANLVCLALVFRHHGEGIHMRASVIFSSKDTIANAGVILSGLLVALLGSPLLDRIIGLAIALLVLRGGLSRRGPGRPATPLHKPRNIVLHS